MAACCICSGNFCNHAKFEKTKEMHRLFQYGAHCLSGRERLAARAECSSGDYRAECGILTSIALAEYLYHSHTNTGNNAARSGFCTGGWLSAVSVLGTSAIRRNLKNRRNAPPVSVRCTLPVSQRTPCSESQAFGWQLPSRTPKPCKVHSCRTLIPFPHKYRKQRYLFQFLHRRTAVCCICSGSCCNPAKFEKQKKCTAYFSTVHIAYQSENALQREPGVRMAIIEQNAEALQGSLLQNIDTIPTQIQETTLPVPVFASEDSCLLYLFWELLQSGKI